MSISDYLRTQGQRPDPLVGSAWSATFAEDVSDITEPAVVVIPAFDPVQQWKGCRWQSRDALTLPNRGDRCLVIFDETVQPWVVAWWPYTT